MNRDRTTLIGLEGIQVIAVSICHGHENQQGRTTSLEKRFAMATFGTILAKLRLKPPS